MAIRVIIMREVDPGEGPKLQRLLMQLRGGATQAKGYISGETLRSVVDPNKYLVISTWNTLEDWQAWEKSPERKAMQAEVAKIAGGREAHYIYGNL